MSQNSLIDQFNFFIENPESREFKSNKVIIIDGTNLFIRSFIAFPTLNNNGEHIGGIFGFLSELKNLIQNFNPIQIHIVFDGVGGKYKRQRIYENYKKRSKPLRSYNRFDNFEIDLLQEEHNKKVQFDTLLRLLSFMPVKIYQIPYIEADDCISYLIFDSGEAEGKHSIICSSDKDFLHLVQEDVMVYNFTKKILYDSKEVKKEFGFFPFNFLTFRCFDGDRSDTIPGVKGVGPVGLKSKFNLDGEEDITVEDIIAKAEEEIENGSNLAIYRNIVDQKNIAMRNLTLMQLFDVAMPKSSKKILKSCVQKPFNPFNYNKLVEAFREIGLSYDFNDFSFWKTAF